jgi:sugar/nucleoside kinase (ribokinase family)
MASQKPKTERRVKTTPSVPSIVGTGLIALDVVIHGNDYQLSQRCAGGTCGNVLIILSYLGWNAYPVSRLNGETASRRVLRDLKRWKVNLDFAKSLPRVNTPIIIHKILSNGSGEAIHRFSLKCLTCGAWLPTYRPITAASAQRVSVAVKKPNAFFFDRVSRGSLMLAEACAKAGALVVFEPSGVGDPNLFSEALSLSHIVKYSKERMESSSKIRANHSFLEIQTLGTEGLRYRSTLPSAKSKSWQYLNACKVSDVKDTAGAGDWCTAGIIHRLASQGLTAFKKTTGNQLQDSIRFGQALAAWTCRFEGARGGMYEVSRARFDSDIEKLMAQFGSRNSKVFDEPISLASSAESHESKSGKISGRKLIKIPSSAPAQDACCF